MICDQTTHMSKPAATKKALEGESFARASAMTDSQYVLFPVREGYERGNSDLERAFILIIWRLRSREL
jgi:hypothetical protein